MKLFFAILFALLSLSAFVQSVLKEARQPMAVATMRAERSDVSTIETHCGRAADAYRMREKGINVLVYRDVLILVHDDGHAEYRQRWPYQAISLEQAVARLGCKP